MLRAGLAAATRRRRRLVVVLAVLVGAGLLGVGAGWLTPGTPERASPSAAAPSAAPVAPPSVDLSGMWVTRANLTLAAIDTQLGVVARAEDVWNSHLAAGYRGTATPPAVAAMLHRKALLEQQKAVLESQLGIWRQVGQTTVELAGVDQQLLLVEGALKTGPAGAGLPPDQVEVIHALTAQRQLLVHSREVQRAELAGLQQGVVDAAAIPLPDPTDRTTPLARAVLDLPPGPAATHNPRAAVPAQIPVIAAGRAPAGGRQQQRQRQEHTASQPVNSDAGPIPEHPARGPGVNPRVGGPGSVVTDPVGHPAVGLVTGATGLLAGKPAHSTGQRGPSLENRGGGGGGIAVGAIGPAAVDAHRSTTGGARTWTPFLACGSLSGGVVLVSGSDASPQLAGLFGEVVAVAAGEVGG